MTFARSLLNCREVTQIRSKLDYFRCKETSHGVCNLVCHGLSFVGTECVTQNVRRRFHRRVIEACPRGVGDNQNPSSGLAPFIQRIPAGIHRRLGFFDRFAKSGHGSNKESDLAERDVKCIDLVVFCRPV